MVGRRRPCRVFICPACQRSYGDPHYHGPAGHAPRNLCFDCWAAEWDLIAARMLNGGNWTVLDAALWLVCSGFTRQQAATIVGVARRTLYRWIRALKTNPRKVPQWLQRADWPIFQTPKQGTHR